MGYIIIWVLVILYNLFFNKQDKDGFGPYDLLPFCRVFTSVLLGAAATILLLMIN